MSTDYFPHLVQTLQHLAPDAAVALLLGAVAEHPGDARPLLLLAAEHAQANRMDRAEAAFSAALLLAPDFAIARFQLGLLQYSGARPATAFVTWAPLEALATDHPLRLFKEALELFAADQFEQAASCFRAGIAHNHDNPPLSGDMQRFLDAIDALRGQAPLSAPPMAPTMAPASPVDTEPASEHYLVSGYRLH